jgi:adenylate kinase
MPPTSKSSFENAPYGRLVAVFGISGVGKTTLISHFVREHQGWRVLSASGLLAQMTQIDSDELRRYDRANIETNQFSLASAIQQKRATAPELNWLLDAHSVIDNDQELIAVPTQVIKQINPDSLIFVQDDPEKILRRRISDRDRRRALPSSARVEEEQTLALQTCLAYSSDLKIILHRIMATDATTFAKRLLEIALTEENTGTRRKR